MKNNTLEKLDTVSYGTAANGDVNNLESIETVYSDDVIDLLDTLEAEPTTTNQSNPFIQQGAANDKVVEAGIYSLSGTRRSKLDKSLERRASKSRLTDRRESMRMDANGKAELDRRAENRLVNIESLRQKD